MSMHGWAFFICCTQQSMPAVSKAQRRAMAIAEHHPEKTYARNRGLLKMTKGQLHDFAATKEKNLPKRVSKRSAGRRGGR